MMDFSNPIRYSLQYANPYGDSEEMAINQSRTGDYVHLSAYRALLEEYNKVKDLLQEQTK